MTISEYKFNSDISYRKSGDCILAYHKYNGTLFEFNETGAEIFEMVYINQTVESILQLLCDRYTVEKHDIEEDVQDILNRFLELSIIQKIC